MSNSPADDSRASLRTLGILCATGVALRAVFLLLAGELPLQSDEANYVYLALVWDRFGVYVDGHRFLWPPGMPFVLRECLRLFEHGGLEAARWLQVLASASIGASTMLLARHLFGQRAAVVAGLLWCVNLPLIAYTHRLWPEPLFLALFLPAVHQLVVVAGRVSGRRVDARLVAAGLLLGGSLYLKEVALYLVPLLALVLFARTRDAQGTRVPVEGLRRAALLALSVAAVVTPWTLRNLEVYGRFVPVGATTGENAFGGLNAHYRNYDVQPFRKEVGGVGPERAPRTREWFTAVDPDSAWKRSQALNTIDRQAENRRLGMSFAREHPGWLVRSRIKKLADFFAPVSFFTRHMGLGHYAESALSAPGLRHALVLWSLLCSAGVLALGAAGFWGTSMDRDARWMVGCVLAYFVGTSLLVAMSRFRLPIVPLLIVFSAGFLTRERAVASRPIAIAVGLALLVLWWIDLPEILGLMELAWSPES